MLANSSAITLIGTNPENNSIRTYWPAVPDNLNAGQEIASTFRSVSGERISVRLQVSSDDSFSVVRVIASLSESEEVPRFHSQRLESLGLLASGVAHDFNNVLTGILGHGAYLKTILGDSGQVRESLDAIEDGALKASAMTQAIVRFAKFQSDDAPAKVDVGDMVARTCALLRRAIPPEYELAWKLPEDPVFALGSESQLAQVLINLIVNARDAIKGRGTITVSVSSLEDRETIEAAFGSKKQLPSAKYISLSVKDTGEGMTQEVMRRVFEPFFSTKKDHGSGLGLSTVAAIIRGYGGTVKVKSKVGQGTVFEVLIPLLDEEMAAKKGAADSAVRGNGERILVVDDEPAVRNVLGISLEHLGYHVVTAASGIEAIDRFKESSGAFDLIVLDMMMPGLSGEEVFDHLRKMQPGIRTLVVSGFASDTSVQKILDAGHSAYIQKPFTVEALSAKVRTCLDE